MVIHSQQKIKITIPMALTVRCMEPGGTARVTTATWMESIITDYTPVVRVLGGLHTRAIQLKELKWRSDRMIFRNLHFWRSFLFLIRFVVLICLGYKAAFKITLWKHNVWKLLTCDQTLLPPSSPRFRFFTIFFAPSFFLGWRKPDRRLRKIQLQIIHKWL